MLSSTAFASLRGSRSENEDTHFHIKTDFNISGKNVPIESWGIFDGHLGISTAKFLEKKSFEIFKKHFQNCVKNINNKQQVYKAFKSSQLEWQIKTPNHNNGATVIFILYIPSNNTVYNLSIGDGRFNYFNKNTGKTYETDIDYIDFIDNEEKKYHGKTINNIHQINGRILKKNGEIPTTTKLDNVNYDEYFCENDTSDSINFREWVKFNKYFNTTSYVIFPKFSSSCYRMISLQPTRTIGREESLHLGELMSFKIDKNIKACFSCDGLEDNNALIHEDIGKILIQPNLSNEKFFNKTINKFFSKCVIPKSDTTLIEKVEWIRKLFDLGGALYDCDDNWRKGLDESIPYFKNYDLNNIKDLQEQVDFISNLAVVRLSGDNVTLGLAEFNDEQNDEQNGEFDINNSIGLTNMIRSRI